MNKKVYSKQAWNETLLGAKTVGQKQSNHKYLYWEIQEEYRPTHKWLAKEKNVHVVVLGDLYNNMGDVAMKMLEKSGFRPSWKDLKIDLS